MEKDINKYIFEEEVEAVLDLDITTELYVSKKDHPEGKIVPVSVDGREEFVLIPLDIKDRTTLKFSNRGRHNPATGKIGDLYVVVHIEENKHSRKAMIISVTTALAVAALILAMLFVKKPEQKQSTEEQLIDAATETHAVPANRPEMMPVQLEWSDWVEELPAYVNETDFEIKEDILYSSQNIEITSSTETDTMEGWELFDTVESDGEFGPWSEWSDIPVESTPTRMVQTETRYRYQDRETTTSASPSLDGWTLYDTTYKWGNFGAPSEWSENPVTASDSREVKTKQQYQYRDKWTEQVVTGWETPGEWTFDRQATSDQIKEESRTVYGYCYFECPYCGAHMHGWGQCWTWAGGCGAATTDGNWHEIWSEIPWDQAGLQDWHGTGKYYTEINGERVFKWPEGGSRTQYRYAKQAVQTVSHEGSWSDWEDTPYTASSTREVRTRTMYSYTEREQIPTYHFYRWGNLSGWSKNEVSATDDRRVESKVVYRYCDQVTEKTYYFSRLTEWSDFTDEEVISSDRVNVKTKKVYSYKSKLDSR